MDKLLACVNDTPGIQADHVIYRRIRDLESDPPTVDELPFLKRRQYEDESEFRLIYKNRNKSYRSKDFVIDLRYIERITLSPWLPQSISKTVKELFGV